MRRTYKTMIIFYAPCEPVPLTFSDHGVHARSIAFEIHFVHDFRYVHEYSSRLSRSIENTWEYSKCPFKIRWMKFRYPAHGKSAFVSTVPVYQMERALHIWNVDDPYKWDPIYGVHQKYIWRSSQQTCSKTTRKTRDFGNMLQHVGWELRQIYSPYTP